MDIPAPLHVLLIEDSPEDRADIRQMLLLGSQRHYKFTEMETGAAGVRALLDHGDSPPDCVLLDFNLPDMNAFEVLTAMRGGGELTICPVVVVTGSTDRGAEVIRAGAHDYVGKSWATPESLTRSIENAVERYALSRERLLNNAALRKSQHFLQRITEVAPGVLHVFDLEQQRFVFVSPAVASAIGYPAAEITALGRDDLSALLHPEDLPRLAEHLRRVRTLGDEVHVNFEHRVRTKSGEWRWFQNRVSVFARDAEGAVHQTIGAALDITERKRVEETFAQNAALFAKIIEQAPGGVYVMDAQLRVREVNTEALPAFASVQPVIGRDLGEMMEALWGPELGRECTAIFRRTLETGERYVSPRFDHRRQDISVDQAYEWQTQRLTMPDGQHGVVCYFQDVTARERAAAALRTEVAERKQAEEQVRLLNRDLEQRVADRVEELGTKARLLAERNAEVELARVALEEKAAELARASVYKSEFLANMSHELRTPLNVILLLSQQLAQNKPGNLSAKQREFAHLVHSSGTDLLNLINDILDLAKIESGTVTVKVGEVSLARLCDGLTRHFQPVAGAKKLTLHASLAGDLPPGLQSDQQRVWQILKNLVANALKFTARGHVEVRVGLATQGWPPDHPVLGRASQVIAFAVEDTGIGIAAAQQRRIFASFQQADATTSRHYGGTGLGLAISRALAAQLGGAITLVSAPGLGSTFTLYLPQNFVSPERTGETEDRKIIVEILPRSEPLADGPDHARRGAASPFPAEAPVGKARPEVSREILRGRKVLVVDDDVRNIFALTALLENHDVETLSATDGRSAIRLLETTPDVSLVLMDIMMPDIDGYETMRQLRQSPQFRTLPILALTAHAMPGDREKCLEAGASDYITKPVNSDELLAVMSDWMAR